MSDALLTIPETAERLKVSISTVRRLIDSEELPVVRLPGRIVRVRPEDIAALVEAATDG